MAQTFFPITPTEITVSAADEWVTVDASAVGVPEGATGVVVHIVNTSASLAFAVGLRKNGSTDDRHTSLYMNQHCWGLIGVDANRVFEAYVGNTTDIDIYVVGYTKSGVTFFTNSIEYTISGDAWEEKDATSDTSANTIGLIFEIDYNGTKEFGARKNGSTDNRTNVSYYRQPFGLIIGCDANQVVELYGEAGTFTGDPAPRFQLLGYVEDGCTFNTNATDVSLGTTGSWLDLSALPDVSPPPNMGFIEVIATGGYNFGLRKDGSSEDIYKRPRRHSWGVVECAANRVIEGKIEDTGCDFFVVGYSTIVLGWSGKVSGVTNPAKVMGVDVANIAKVKGVVSA